MILAHAYRLGGRLVRVTPPPARYAMWGAAAGGFYALNPFRRRALRTNYAAALGLPVDDPQVLPVARRAAANYGRMLADFLLLGSIPPDEVRRMISHDGREHVDAAIARGRGAILALPHMGSWDLCGALGGVFGYPILAVAEPMPGSLNQEIVATRSRHGLRIVMLGRAAAVAVGRALQANEIVALLCDVPHGPGAPVRLFGRRATFPLGPASLACHHSSPVLPVYSRRIGPGRYHAHVDPAILPPARGAGRGAAIELMQHVADRFEGFIAAHPDQWYAFRPLLGE